MPKGVYQRKPGVMSKKDRCPHGHDTTDSASRDKNGDCKLCRNARHKIPEAKATRKKWLSTPAGMLWSLRNRLRTSGWTPEMFYQALQEQKNCCALCHKPFTKDEPPYADHKHSDNTPRGLLHPNCNVAIGFLKDNPDLCRMAGDYLEVWEKREEEVLEAQQLMGRLGLPQGESNGTK